MTYLRVLFAILSVVLYSCAENTTPKSAPQSDSLLIQDSLKLIQAKDYRKRLLTAFKDTSAFDVNETYYHFIYFSSFQYGVSVRFQKKDTLYFLKVSTLNPPDSSARNSFYETKIDKYEWRFLEYMIDDYGVWDGAEYKGHIANDGYIYFLEANRVDQLGIQHKFLVRRNAHYDKIDALCRNIYSYQEELVFKYKQFDQEY